MVAVSRDGCAGLFAGLDEGRAGYVVLELYVASCLYVKGVPSIDIFFPSVWFVSMHRRPQWAVAQTYSELDLCWPVGRGSKSPAAIEGCTLSRPLQRPDELLPQHIGGSWRWR